MNIDRVIQVLSKNEGVYCVNVLNETSYRKKAYKRLIECDLKVMERRISTIIAIPTDWSRTLVDVYIKQHEDFPYIPHIDTQGKICLFDLEGILIDPNLEGIVVQSIERAKSIIIEGLNGTNKLDFIEEFDLYWCQFSGRREAKFIVPSNFEIQLVKCAQNELKQRERKILKIITENSKQIYIYIAKDAEELKKYDTNGIMVS